MSTLYLNNKGFFIITSIITINTIIFIITIIINCNISIRYALYCSILFTESQVVENKRMKNIDM